MKGKVKFWNDAKGWGFITGEDGIEYFAHFSGTLDKVQTNDEVEFDVEHGDRGPKAVNVKRIKV